MNKIELDVNKIREKLSATDIKLGTYRYIMDAVHKTDVSTDSRFQHEYKSFYGMHQYTDADFCKVYFEYMEANKTGGINFENVIIHLYHGTSGVQPSFSSKLLHTVNPDMPILDSRVKYHLKLKTIPYYFPRVLRYYEEFVEIFSEYLTTQNAADVIGVFDDIFGDTELTAVKKIDNAIWSLGKAK